MFITNHNNYVLTENEYNTYADILKNTIDEFITIYNNLYFKINNVYDYYYSNKGAHSYDKETLNNLKSINDKAKDLKIIYTENINNKCIPVFYKFLVILGKYYGIKFNIYPFHKYYNLIDFGENNDDIVVVAKIVNNYKFQKHNLENTNPENIKKLIK